MSKIEDEDFVVVGVVSGTSASIEQLVHRDLSRPAARRDYRLKVIHRETGGGDTETKTEIETKTGIAIETKTETEAETKTETKLIASFCTSAFLPVVFICVVVHSLFGII